MARSTPMPAGNFNLRGKLSRLLRCGCCVARDFREQFRLRDEGRMALQEIEEIYAPRSAAGQLGTKAAATAPSDGGTQEASEPVSNPRPESRRQRDRHHS